MPPHTFVVARLAKSILKTLREQHLDYVVSPGITMRRLAQSLAKYHYMPKTP